SPNALRYRSHWVRGPHGNGPRLSRGEDRPAAELAARIPSDSGGDEPADASCPNQPGGTLQRARLAQAAPGEAESPSAAVRAGARSAGDSRARTVGTAAGTARHTVPGPARRDDPHLGPRSAARARPHAAVG